MKSKPAWDAVVFAGAVGLGCLCGYLLMRDERVKSAMKDAISTIVGASRQSAHAMSEDVMLHKAKVTGDPAVNQDWVASQWDAL